MQKLLLIIIIFGIGFFFVYISPNTPSTEKKDTTGPTVHTNTSAPPTQETLIIHEIIPANFRNFIMHDPKNPQFISGWSGLVTSTDAYILNGSYFDENNGPSGFLVVDGKRIGQRMFDQDKSGLIVLSNSTFSIRDLAQQPIKKEEKFRFALQSYPFLIRNKKAAITVDSGKKARRSAIGVDEQGNIYLIFSADSSLTLYGFAQQLTLSEIPFQHVLNLDGGPSSGLFVREQGQTRLYNSLSPMPNVIVFEKKL